MARRAWQVSLTAYKHAYCDPAGKDDVSRRLAAERGAELDWNVFFNHRRVLSREPAATVDDMPALAQSTLSWGQRNDMPGQKVFLYAKDASEAWCYELGADLAHRERARRCGTVSDRSGELIIRPMKGDFPDWNWQDPDRLEATMERLTAGLAEVEKLEQVSAEPPLPGPGPQRRDHPHGGDRPMKDKVVVQFAGDGSGVAELSWGQQEIWSVMEGKDSSLPMGGARALPPGQTVADVAAGLSFIMSRHQALRTRLRFGPGGKTQQAVHASGAITLEVVDAGDGDPGEVAAAVAAKYQARKFDYEHEWPLRMAVITHHGNATHVAQVICHIALDAFGLAVLQDDFDHRDERTGPVTAMQPMEQASLQRGPSGRRAHEASIRYFERLAASVPDRQFKASADPRQPRFWQVTLDSPAGYQAAGMLAARLGVSTSPVLLAAFAVAITSVSVSQRVAVHLVVSNRFRRGFADSVSPVMQNTLGVIETDGPFEEVVRRAWQSGLGAYKHAYYDPLGKSEVYERVKAERGAEPDWGVVFNDRRVLSRESADTVSAADGAPSLRDELTRSTLTWGDRNDMPQPKVDLNICDAPDTLCCQMWADTHFVSPADMEGLLRSIETVVVNAAQADAHPPAEPVLHNP